MLLALRGRSKLIVGLQTATRHWKTLLLSAILISSNWFFYIYGVNSGRVLETSLGYFINPLVNVLLGMLFLGERLRRLQWLALALATVGVAQLAVQGPAVPWLSLFLAFSFGFYGLIRKKAPVPPLAASTFESALMIPPALVFLIAFAPVSPDASATHFLWLVLGGVVTGLPLLWFTEAASRLPLSTLGFFQYIAPTLQFSLAVFAFSEPFTPVHARAFAFIWAGLALYTVDLAWDFRRAKTGG